MEPPGKRARARGKNIFGIILNVPAGAARCDAGPMRDMRDVPFGRVIKVHPYAWLWEPLEGDAGFLQRPMFGGKAVYVDGRMALFFSAKEEPWRGVFVCTEREYHASLMAEFPALAPHKVLPKWLYLSESEDCFERVAEKLVALAKRRDARIGIAGKARKPGNAGNGKSGKGRRDG
jgi:hypothetical protein